VVANQFAQQEECSMAVHSNSEESRILRQLVPLATFPSDAFKELCTNITVEQVQDAAIFKRGDTNTDLVYLLDGSVTLQAEGLVVEVITSDSESAKFALAHQIPRKIDAVANGVARIVRLDADTVNNPPPAVYHEDQGYTVIDESFEESDDWMTAVLRLPLFQSLPPANLQKILISLKTSQYSAGEVVIAEGSDVDYFFIIQKGQCLLARKVLDEEFELRLNAGDSFGEEYLITDRPAQETITALTDISLIQLEKKHFITQIKTPSIQYVDHEAIPGVPGNGSVLLDVRLPHHFENQNLDGSANIPLLSLRLRLAEIPKDKQIIVVCEDGKASEAGAFLLNKYKCNAVVLKDGMGIEKPDDEPIAQETPEAQQVIVQPDNPSDKEISELSGEGINADIETLRSEYAKLAQRNRELEEKNAALQAEKEQAENQCQLLTQQLERLKEILGRLTKRQ
jgi:rhodanese-related sulfurtransferase